MKNKIYFNTNVSLYFNVPFVNNGEITSINASYIRDCSIVSWDIDTKKILDKCGDSTIKLTGIGSGWWEFDSIDVQNKPDTDTWNKDDQEKSGYNKFMKGGGIFLFI